MTDDKSSHHLIQTVLTLWKMVQKLIIILLTDVDKNFKLLHVIKSLLFLELHVYFGFISLLILNAIPFCLKYMNFLLSEEEEEYIYILLLVSQNVMQ